LRAAFITQPRGTLLITPLATNSHSRRGEVTRARATIMSRRVRAAAALLGLMVTCWPTMFACSVGMAKLARYLTPQSQDVSARHLEQTEKFYSQVSTL
jgi:hypothetical protein